MAIEAVIFDIGGVLVRTLDWSYRSCWEQRLGLPDRDLSSLVFDTEQARLASTGRVSDEVIWQHVASSLRLSDQQLAAMRQDFWEGDQANEEMIDFMRRLRPRYKTGILSNAWPEMRVMNESRFGLLDAVDFALYSFQTGFLKPLPTAYAAILNHLSVASQNTVFIDDSAVNIEGANRIGLQTVHFKQTEQTITEILVLMNEP